MNNMKTDSSIILEKLIKTSLLQENTTGLVYDPLPSKQNKKPTTNDADSWWPNDVGDIILYGSILLLVTGYLGHLGIKIRMNRIARKNLAPGAEQMLKAAETKWTMLDTAALLRLYRGLGSDVNIKRFAAWIRANRTSKVRVPAGTNLTDLAEQYSTKLDPLDARKIWKENESIFRKAGMTKWTDNIPSGGIKDVKIPRDMSFEEGTKILTVLNNGELVRELRRLSINEVYKQFKRGKISAAEFIKNLPKPTADKVGSGLKKMEQQGLGGIPPININVTTAKSATKSAATKSAATKSQSKKTNP